MTLVDSNLAGAVGIDFSVLLSRHGSVYEATNAIVEAASYARQNVDLSTHRQFFYVTRSQDLQPAALSLGRSLNLKPHQVGLAALGTGSEYRSQAEAAWVLAASCRLDRWTNGSSGAAASVSTIWRRPHGERLGLATLGTPPWRNLVRGLPLGDAVLPARLIREYLAENGAQVAVSVDFIAYNRAVRIPGGVLGYGVSDKMEEYARALKFQSLADGELSHQLFARRLSLQRLVDDFEDAVRTLVTARDGILIPASSDGSIGNDGILALVSRDMSQDLSKAVAALCASLGIDAAIHAVDAHLGTTEWLKQSEQCLAAKKAIRFLGKDGIGVPWLGRCRICTSWPGRYTNAYLAKQEAIFRDCPTA